MTKINASVFIITLNEARNIGRALRSVSDFAHIVVVDSGSTDNTVQIAKTFTPHVVHHDFENFAAQKNYALSLCERDWVLNLDADEVVSPGLLAEICTLVDENTVDALDIGVADTLDGKPLHPWTHVNRKLRFFHRVGARYPRALVHESVRIEGCIAKARHPIWHYGVDTLAIRRQKSERYAALAAKSKFECGVRPNPLKLALIYPFAFFKSYVLRRQFLNGSRGLAIARVAASYACAKQAGLHALWRQKKEEPGET